VTFRNSITKISSRGCLSYVKKEGYIKLRMSLTAYTADLKSVRCCSEMVRSAYIDKAIGAVILTRLPVGPVVFLDVSALNQILEILPNGYWYCSGWNDIASVRSRNIFVPEPEHAKHFH